MSRWDEAEQKVYGQYPELRQRLDNLFDYAERVAIVSMLGDVDSVVEYAGKFYDEYSRVIFPLMQLVDSPDPDISRYADEILRYLNILQGNVYNALKLWDTGLEETYEMGSGTMSTGTAGVFHETYGGKLWRYRGNEEDE